MMIKKICAIMFFSFFLIFAGVNSGAVFSVDMVPITAEDVEDSYYDTLLDQQFRVAVYVNNVSNLNAFSVRLKIVSGEYTADNAVKDTTGRTNILETGGKTGMFFDNIESDKIEFVGSIGSSTSSPSSSGLLGIFTFTSNLIWNDIVDIEIYDAVLTSTNGDVDEFTSPSTSFNAGTYSVIQPHTVTVAYTGNGSVSPEGDNTVLHGKNLSISATADIGWHFVNWTVIGGLSVDNVNSASTQVSNVTGNGTVTANFAGNTYTVTFDKQLGSGGDDNVTATYGSAMPSATAPTRTGYTFAGYYDATSGGNQYYTETMASARGWDKASDATLYARWTANTYLVTFDKQDGSGGSNNVTATYGSAMPSATAPSRMGYTFAGYYDATSGGNQYYTETMASARGWDKASDATLYARWTANTYLVTFDKQDGSGGSNNVTATYGSAMPSATAPSRAGYTFAGYYDATSGGTQYYTAAMASAQNWDKTANATLYARWTANTYTVTFVAGSNGDITGDKIQTVTHGGNCTQVTAVPATDYHFIDWTGSYTGTTNPLIITNVTTDMTITANFAQSGSIIVSGLDTSANVYIHATNSWQGTKALDGNGTISDLKPGIYVLSAREQGKRSEVVSVTVNAGIDTPVSITLRDAIPVIFTGKTALQDKYSNIINTSGTFNSSVMDDIDRDGDVDLVVVEADGDINYYINDGGLESATFGHISLGTGENIVCVRCADLNADGERELVIGLSTGEIFLFDMDDETKNAFYTAEEGVTGFDITEFNGDDYPDILLGYGDGTVDMLLSDGPGSWALPVNVTSGGTSLNVGADAAPLAMDLDGDGVKDLLVGNLGGDVRWFKGDGTAAFAKRDSVNSGGLPFTTGANTALSLGYNTTMKELPFIIATDANGNVYQANAILLGDVDSDDQVFLTDFTIFVDTWRLEEGVTGWRYDTNFDVSPNSTSGKQEIVLFDFTLFTDSWRKEK